MLLQFILKTTEKSLKMNMTIMIMNRSLSLLMKTNPNEFSIGSQLRAKNYCIYMENIQITGRKSLRHCQITHLKTDKNIMSKFHLHLGKVNGRMRKHSSSKLCTKGLAKTGSLSLQKFLAELQSK